MCVCVIAHSVLGLSVKLYTEWCQRDEKGRRLALVISASSGRSIQSQLFSVSLLSFNLSVGMWRGFLTNIHKLSPEFQWGGQG